VGIHTGLKSQHGMHSHRKRREQEVTTAFWGAGFNLHSLVQEQAKACAPIRNMFIKSP